MTLIEANKPISQIPLFDTFLYEKKGQEASIIPQREKTSLRRGTEVFTNSVLKEAIALLPGMPDTESLEEISIYLRNNLHHSAELTRKRYSSYIIRRMFPEGYADKPIRLFARAFPDCQALREVCFYRFLKVEPLEVKIIEDLIFPNIGNGNLDRSKIRSYLKEKYPNSRSINDCGKAVVNTMIAAGIARANRIKINFSYRDIPLSSFAFILHSEFHESGMYDIRNIEGNRIIKAMLWNPEHLLPSLYELRNQGLISKVSEIDKFRQFTTKYTLEEVVIQLVTGGNNS